MQSLKYWQGRAINLEKLMQDKTDQTIIEVNKLYNKAISEMNSQIQKVFGTYANNGNIDTEMAVKLLNEQQTQEMRNELLDLLSTTSNADLKREIIAKLDAPAYASRINRLEALKDKIYFEARMIGVRELNFVSKRLIDTLEQAYYRQTFDIQQGIGQAYDFQKISNNSVKAMLTHDWTKSGNYSKKIWSNNEKFALSVRDIVEKGVLTGQSTATMRDSLIAVTGINNDKGAKYKSNRLIRTEVSYFSAQGQMLSYQEAEIKKYRFIATLDLITSETCRKLDLKVFDVKNAQSGENLPPIHPHCRSTTMPYIDGKDYSKLQRRARDPVTGKNVLVPANMHYAEWYGKYVKGNEQALMNEKLHKNKSSDRKQYERYKDVLGIKNVPKTLEEFQNIKYNDSDQWETLKSNLRSKNYLQEQLGYVYNGEKQFIPKGTKFNSKPKTIAGADFSVKIRNIDRLISQYGGTENDWNKQAVSIKSDQYVFDVHWYEKDLIQYETKLKHRKERKK